MSSNTHAVTWGKVVQFPLNCHGNFPGKQLTACRLGDLKSLTQDTAYIVTIGLIKAHGKPKQVCEIVLHKS